MNVPVLRFTEFEGEWWDLKLGDIGPVSMCKRVFKDETTPIGDVPFFKIGTFGKEPDAFISRSKFEEFKSKYSFPRVGEILISAAGTIGRTVIYDGADAYFQDSNIVWIANDESRVVNSYLAICYDKIQWTTENTTIARLYNANLKSMTVVAPSLPEQKKIAAFLGVVDAKIAALRDRVAGLERYKRGLMQALFSQTLRFTKEDGSAFPDWEVKRLGVLGTLKSGVGFSEEEQGGTDGVPLYKVSDMNLSGNETRMVRANNYVTQDQIERLRYKPINQPALIFAKVGAAIFLERKRRAQNFLLDNNMMAFMPNSSVSIEFSVFLFAITRLSKYAQVGALPSYNASDVAALKLSIPHSDEQSKIADALSAMDAKIAAATGQLEQMQDFKKGLLQQMFV